MLSHLSQAVHAAQAYEPEQADIACCGGVRLVQPHQTKSNPGRSQNSSVIHECVGNVISALKKLRVPYGGGVHISIDKHSKLTMLDPTQPAVAPHTLRASILSPASFHHIGSTPTTNLCHPLRQESSRVLTSQKVWWWPGPATALIAHSCVQWHAGQPPRTHLHRDMPPGCSVRCKDSMM